MKTNKIEKKKHHVSHTLTSCNLDTITGRR